VPALDTMYETPWKTTEVANVTIRGKVRIRVTISPLINPRKVPSANPATSASHTGSAHLVIIMAMMIPTSDIW